MYRGSVFENPSGSRGRSDALILQTSIFSSSSCRNSPSAPIDEMQDELLAERMAREMYSSLCCREISVL